MSDVGVSTSGRSAPSSTKAATAGVRATPRTVPVAIVKTSPKVAWVGARIGRQRAAAPSPTAR